MHHRLQSIARAVTLAAITIAPAAATLAELPPLIPRETLFGNPERTSPKLSPDGTKLAWIAPDKKNVLQVWVKTLGKDDDKVITADKKRGIRQYSWAEDNKTILYAQDNDGDENFHIYGVDLETGTIRDYTPFIGARATPEATDVSHPDEMLVTINARDRRLFDVYRLTLSTGALVLEAKNPGDLAGWITDKDLHVRGGQASTPDGGTEIRIYDNGTWKTWLTASAEDDVNVVDVTPDGKGFVIQSSLGRDTSAVVIRNIADKSEKVVASSPESDAEEVQINPNTHTIEAVSFAPGRKNWTVVDPSVKPDFEALAKVNDGDFSIVNRDRADKTWLVAYTSDHGPVRFYSYDRTARKATFLFTARPKLENVQLASMKPVVITA